MRPIALVLAILFPILVPAQRQDRHGRNWRVEEQENIRKSFDGTGGSGPQKILADNLFGYIHVTGYSGREIQVTAVQQIGADSKEAAAEIGRASSRERG